MIKMKITEIMSEQEFKLLSKKEKPLLIEFYSSWCLPCKMQKPIIDEFCSIAKDKIEIVAVDVDMLGKIADKYEIRSIPTLAIFVNGVLKEKTEGVQTKGKLAEMVIKYV